MEPILRVLERLKGYNVPYQYRTIATRGELEYALDRYLQPTYKTHPVLYLAFHGYGGEDGEESGIWLAEGEVTLRDLGTMMEGRCANRIVYFGSCSTLDARPAQLDSFLLRTRAIAACGYQEEVDWLESTAFDMLFLGTVQSTTLRRRDSIQRFDEKLEQAVPGLYRNLGFQMKVRPDRRG